MADTLTPEKWGRKESADWWSAGQAARQQNYGAATEMMLDLAGVQAGSRVLGRGGGHGRVNAHGSSSRRFKGLCGCRGCLPQHAKRGRRGGEQSRHDECRDSRYERREY